MTQPSAEKKRLSTTASLRMTPSESASWHARAEAQGQTLSDYIRSFLNSDLLTGISPPVKSRKSKPAFTPVDPAFLFALSKIGNNLNQIARWANSSKSAIEAIQVIAYLNSIENSIIALRENFVFLPSAVSDEALCEQEILSKNKG